MTLKPLNLADRPKNTPYYDKSRDMETAICWNALQKTLLNMDRGDLSGYIKSVRLTETTIVISTTKPIVNAELRMYGSQILMNMNESLELIKSTRRERIIWK